MTVIDLTHTICPDMPVYPGTNPPTLVPANTIESDGFRETVLTMYSHTGTHTDAPAHLISDGITLDRFPASQFVGAAMVLDCTNLSNSHEIPLSLIKQYENELADIDFLLFYTGWDKFWGSDKYFNSYPCLTNEAADYIHSLKLKGIGVDAISIDPVGVPLANHKTFLRDNNFVIVENLTNLGKIGNKPFLFVSLPLKHTDADGAPTRAVAVTL